MQELKPCPFCGHEPEFMSYQFKYVTGITCYNCSVKLMAEDVMIGRSGDVKENLIKIWNTRKRASK